MRKLTNKETQEIADSEIKRIISKTKKMTKAQLIQELIDDVYENMFIIETAQKYMSDKRFISFLKACEEEVDEVCAS